jgi:hypothetical protein
MIIMLNAQRHIISMLSVKWAYYCYGVHIRGRFNFEFGNGMLCSMHIIRWRYPMIGTRVLGVGSALFWPWLMALNEKIKEATCIYCTSFLPVFHGDASPRVGVVGDASLTCPGRGDSRGDVSPRLLFGEMRGDLGGRDSPRWGTRLPKRATPARLPLKMGTFGRPPPKGGLLDNPPPKRGTPRSPPQFFLPSKT